MRKLKTIIVDDVQTMHQALREFVEIELDCEVIGEAYNGKELLNLENIYLADIILLDIEMPEMDGIEAAKLVLWKYPFLKIIAITMYQDRVYLQNLISAGFKGCVFKQNIFGELDRAIDVVTKGKMFYPKNIKMYDGGNGV